MVFTMRNGKVTTFQEFLNTAANGLRGDESPAAFFGPGRA
jgi:hypothetical protein